VLTDAVARYEALFEALPALEILMLRSARVDGDAAGARRFAFQT